MTTAIRVLLCDDHAIVRKGIGALLATQPDIQVVGEASNGVEAVAQAEALRPDVILMDLLMPQLDGIRATQQITAAQPEAHILVLTSFAADDQVFPAIKAGALGYLLKDSAPSELLQAIHRVARANRRWSRRLRARCCSSSSIRPRRRRRPNR
jgi:NarL family two-component system response regulator LiaR